MILSCLVTTLGPQTVWRLQKTSFGPLGLNSTKPFSENSSSRLLTSGQKHLHRLGLREDRRVAAHPGEGEWELSLGLRPRQLLRQLRPIQT